jgi:hypothetical protein
VLLLMGVLLVPLEHQLRRVALGTAVVFPADGAQAVLASRLQAQGAPLVFGEPLVRLFNLADVASLKARGVID